jgi:choline transport protein
MALIALYHESLVIKTWMTFVVYQAFNLITAGIVMFANFAIPALNRFSRTLNTALDRSLTYIN